MNITLPALIAALSIPSAFTGFCFWCLKRKIEESEARKQEEQTNREQARTELEVLTIQGSSAAIALSEAVARALRRGHTNGDTEAALAYAASVKHQQKDFLTRHGVSAILSD